MKINHAEIAKRLLTDEEFTVEMSDLIGEFDLSGVDQNSSSIKNGWNDEYDDCSTISFILNDIIFTAVKDPNDGYRSSMRCIFVEKFKVHNEFQPIKVYTKMKSENNEEDVYSFNSSCDILEMYDKENDEIILRIGTDNADDYYPWFVADWNPEKMAINNE